MLPMAQLRWLTAGESHGPGLTVIVEGVPAGLAVDSAMLRADLERRQQGYGRGGRMRIETDSAQIQAGVRLGKTLGSPIALWIANADHANWTDRMAVAPSDAQPDPVLRPRPGHADLAGALKYQTHDVRNVLERASARETAARVAAGAIARALLGSCGVRVRSRVRAIGPVEIPQDAPDLGAADECILQSSHAGTTLGGVFEVVADNVPAGLGSYAQWDLRLDGRLAQALMSIPAIKAVAIGDGIETARQPGQFAHDPIGYDADAQRFSRASNHAGGIEGGISNGEPIVARAWMKPLPTQKRALPSVDLRTKKSVEALNERHDVCAVLAASVVGEAMLSLTLAAALLECFPADTIGALRAAVDAHRTQLRSF